MDLEKEWQRQMAEEYWLPAEQKEGRDLLFLMNLLIKSNFFNVL